MAKHVVDILKDRIKGISRPNLFEVELIKPRPRPGVNDENISVAQNLIKSIQLPQVMINDIEIKRMGISLTVPGGINFTPVTINFHDDVEGKVRTFINDWMKIYVTDIVEGNYTKEEDIVLTGQVKIYQLNGKHERTTLTILTHAYPKMLSEIDLNHDTEDSLNSFNTTFAFSVATYEQVQA